MSFQPRLYRSGCAPEGLEGFSLAVAETDLFIAGDGLMPEMRRLAEETVLLGRRQLESYIDQDPGFAASFAPWPVPETAPEPARRLAEAAEAAGVGPMAGVAGLFADLVAEALRTICDRVIVENGGDVMLATGEERTVAIGAGDSPWSGRLGLIVPAAAQPLGICTSSRTVGPSISLGRADAAAVACQTAVLADAFASRLGNMVHKPEDLPAAADWVKDRVEIISGVIVLGDGLAVAGQLEVKPL